MFDQFNGLPVHVLVVHAAVVFVPLLAIAAVVYAFVPAVRARIGWTVGLLAVGAPVAALVARLSGESFRARMIENGMAGDALVAIDAHGMYGIRTFWSTLGLGVATGVLLTLASGRVRRLPKAVSLAVSAVVVVLAAVAGYYVYRTGDSGAVAVWGAAS